MTSLSSFSSKREGSEFAFFAVSRGAGVPVEPGVNAAAGWGEVTLAFTVPAEAHLVSASFTTLDKKSGVSEGKEFARVVST
jgi:hypothetical protein